MGRSEGWQPTDFGDQNPQTYEPDGSSDAEVREGDLINMSNRVLDEYARASLQTLRPMVRSGNAREVLGFVRNRPGETQHMIDAVGEQLMANIMRSHRFPGRIIGEHNTNSPLGEYVPIRVNTSIDSLDNTRPYVLGLDIPPYSVAANYDTENNPIGAVTINIRDNLIYYCVGESNVVRDMETGIVKTLSPSTRTDIKDPDLTIASFVSENDYSLPFFDNFRLLIEEMDKNGFLYPGGGAFIYSQIAKGAVDAYVMVDEPRSEIDPGLPFAITAGCTIVSVNPETGEYTPYHFDPSKTAESVPLFICAARPEIRDEIIRLYMEGKERRREEKESIEFYRELHEAHLEPPTPPFLRK